MRRVAASSLSLFILHCPCTGGRGCHTDTMHTETLNYLDVPCSYSLKMSVGWINRLASAGRCCLSIGWNRTNRVISTLGEKFRIFHVRMPCHKVLRWPQLVILSHTQRDRENTYIHIYYIPPLAIVLYSEQDKVMTKNGQNPVFLFLRRLGCL